MKEIILTKGKVTIVDDDVYEVLHRSNISWHFGAGGYAAYDNRQGKLDVFRGTTVFLHNLVYYILEKDIPNNLRLDHINRNKLDNRVINLRLVTNQENSMNKTGYNKTSNYKGVHRTRSGTYNCQIKINYKSKNIGTLKDQVLLAKYYDAVVRYYYGNNAYTNFKEEYIKPLSFEDAKLKVKEIANGSQDVYLLNTNFKNKHNG